MQLTEGGVNVDVGSVVSALVEVGRYHMAVAPGESLPPIVVDDRRLLRIYPRLLWDVNRSVDDGTYGPPLSRDELGLFKTGYNAVRTGKAPVILGCGTGIIQ